ncbi:Abasic site processing protein [Pararobbsia alpina]|uniref:SOS response-associated peptidase n=1 Tax=Pararobbsia alpina TaxID=621374 RepID=UPI0039A54609
MCGRIAQYRDARDYAQALTLTSPVFLFDPADRRPGFNLAPGAHPLAILPDQTIRTIRWGYRPAWAAEQHLPQAINARSDSAASSGYFREMWRHGRVIVPLDGWFEWRTESGRSQPYFVYPRSREPIFAAGLSSVVDANDHLPGDGVVLVTVAAAGSVVDTHGHQPLCFDAHAALQWLDRGLRDDAVQELVRSRGQDAWKSGSASAAVVSASASTSASMLDWHRVSQNVNRATFDEATLIETID